MAIRVGKDSLINLRTGRAAVENHHSNLIDLFDIVPTSDHGGQAQRFVGQVENMGQAQQWVDRQRELDRELR